MFSGIRVHFHHSTKIQRIWDQKPLPLPNQTRPEEGTAAAPVVGARRKERNPVAWELSCSSRKRSSGARNAPWRQTTATPSIKAETRTDPTLVRKTTKTVSPERIISVSKSVKVRPKRTRGRSVGRKR